MNAEQLQDALNQLPDDLLIAADALRQKKKEPILWKRLVPIAACFVLVMGALLVTMPLLNQKDAAAPEYQMMQDSSVEMVGAPADSAAPEAGEPEAPMEQNPVPTRAEVSDIFNAVADGSWGVMLTGETAAGRWPVEAITYMANTAREAEHWLQNA